MQFSIEDQEKFVRLAMEQAEESIRKGGTPFGAVLVSEIGEVIAGARNTVTTDTDILQHAELNSTGITRLHISGANLRLAPVTVRQYGSSGSLALHPELH